MPTLTYGGPLPWQQEVNKAVDYSVLAADVGTLFTTGGGATRTFTLPALAAANVGIAWWFLNIQANNMVITAPANKLIADGNLTGTTATYSTASHIIGSFCMVYLNQAGTFYVLVNMGATTVTIT